jgi:hypothetical protein
MRGPPMASGGGGSLSVASPALLVILILMIGATIYLWRKRFIRRKTAYVTLAILVIALILTGISLNSSGA